MRHNVIDIFKDIASRTALLQKCDSYHARLLEQLSRVLIGHSSQVHFVINTTGSRQCSSFAWSRVTERVCVTRHLAEMHLHGEQWTRDGDLSLSVSAPPPPTSSLPPSLFLTLPPCLFLTLPLSAKRRKNCFTRTRSLVSPYWDASGATSHHFLDAAWDFRVSKRRNAPPHRCGGEISLLSPGVGVK